VNQWRRPYADREQATFDEIQLGYTASLERTLQAGDIRAWATAFGDAGAVGPPRTMRPR
jgi:hypothetical protein